MLNGLDGVLLVYFAVSEKAVLEGDDMVRKPVYGLPIPIYLSEELTGLYIDRESYALQISTDTVADISDNNNLKVIQRGETQTQYIEFIGVRDSIGLNIILPLLQTIYNKLLYGKDYNLAYFHQNCLIFNAKLAQYNVEQSREDDLVKIRLTLEVKPPQQTEKKQPTKMLGFAGETPEQLLPKGAA